METSPPPHSQWEISDGWRTVAFITWVMVTAALVAISISSRTTGRPVWWLGPSTNPAPIFYLLVPIAIVAAPVYASFRKPAHMGNIGIVSSVILGGTALFDLSDKPGVAIAIAIVAIAALCESIALTVVTRHYR